MDTRIVLLSRMNPENCIGYWIAPALDQQNIAFRLLKSFVLVKPSVY
ncbi:MAG: hypothetical protein RLZZ589_1588 [Cyanobacteriota bacterium]